MAQAIKHDRVDVGRQDMIPSLQPGVELGWPSHRRDKRHDAALGSATLTTLSISLRVSKIIFRGTLGGAAFGWPILTGIRKRSNCAFGSG